MAIRHTKRGKANPGGEGYQGIDLDRINNLLSKLQAASVSDRPEGWTVKEYAEQQGLKPGTATDRVLRLHRAGLLEREAWQNGKSLTYVYRIAED